MGCSTRHAALRLRPIADRSLSAIYSRRCSLRASVGERDHIAGEAWDDTLWRMVIADFSVVLFRPNFMLVSEDTS